MTSFAILRIAKHSSLASLAGVARHHSRQSPVRGAEPSLSAKNLSWGAAKGGSAGVVSSVSAVLSAAQAKQKKAFRRDGVKAVEYMLTASPEWWKAATVKQQAAFFDRARRWLREKHGADCVVAEWLHLDEKSKNFHAVVVPLHEGRPNARHFFGGRAKLEALQSEFAALMQPLGLSRGVRGSDATHVPVRDWWQALDRPPEPVGKADYLKKAMGLPVPALDLAERKAAAFEANKKALARIREREAAAAKRAADLDIDLGLLKRDRALLLEREAKARELERENRVLRERVAQLAPKSPAQTPEGGYFTKLGLG